MEPSEQTSYWVSSSEEDLEAARHLKEKGLFRHALFFGHMAVEKVLKAHVTQATQDFAPKTHNLVRLAEISDLTLEKDQLDILKKIREYNIEGRYPDSSGPPLDKAESESLFAEIIECHSLLKKMLS